MIEDLAAASPEAGTEAASSRASITSPAFITAIASATRRHATRRWATMMTVAPARGRSSQSHDGGSRHAQRRRGDRSKWCRTPPIVMTQDSRTRACGVASDSRHHLPLCDRVQAGAHLLPSGARRNQHPAQRVCLHKCTGEDAQARLGAERSAHLVEQKERGAADQRAGERDAGGHPERDRAVTVPENEHR